MSERLDLTRLSETLRRRYAAARPPLVVRATDAGRSLSVVPAESETVAPSKAGVQASTRGVPYGKAFELYVSVESPVEAASRARIAPPVQAGRTLALEEGRRRQMWTLAGPDGDRVVVRLQLGEDMTEEEARQLLELVGEAIAP